MEDRQIAPPTGNLVVLDREDQQLMSMMQASVIRAHGGPENLLIETVARPQPRPHEVLVKVAACSLNHLDIFVRRGMPGVSITLPHTTGGDITGWVQALGAGVTGIQVGTPVLVDPAVEEGALGENKAGGLAEFVLVPEQNLLRLDSEEQLINLATLPIAYGTAHRMLFDRAQLIAGETLVIVGASGGVGVACVQLGQRVGARVIACTSTEAKAERLREIGADESVVAHDQEYGKEVWSLTGRIGADVVVDYSGEVTWPGSLRCVRPGGRLVTCGATSGYSAITDLRYLWAREIDIRGSNGWSREGLNALRLMVEGGALVPVIHGIFPLSRAREAVAELEERRAFGKVIVVPDLIYGRLQHVAKR